MPSRVLPLLFALVTLVPTLLPGSGGDRRTVTLLVTSGTSGRLVADDGSTPAALAALVREITAPTDRGAVVIDAGRTLAPYAESRPDGGRAVLSALAAAGCDAFVPDPVDFSAGLVALAQLAEEVPFPVLRPFEDARGTALGEGARLDLGDGLVVAVSSRFDPAFSGALEAAGVAAPRLAFQVRGQQPPAALRIAVVHSRGTGPSLADRGWLWRLLEQPDGANLLLEPDLGQDLLVRRETGDGPVFLIGRALPPAGSWQVLRVDVDLEDRAGEWRMVDVRAVPVLPPPGLSEDGALRGRMLAAAEAFRRAYASRLPEGAPRDQEGLERFVLGALREAAGAELAVLNRGTLRTVPAALLGDGPPTEEAVVRMLSLDQTVQVVELDGAELRALAVESARRPRRADGSPPRDSLRFLGLDYTETGAGTPEARVSTLRVNGRAVRDEDRYRVAVGGYLAAGGDGYDLVAGADPLMLRSGDGRPLELREDVVLPRLRAADLQLADLGRRPVWRWGVDRTTLSASGVTTDRPEGYQGVPDSRARADDSFSLLADVRLRADRELPAWRWENRVDARLGFLDLEGAPLQETDDDLRFDSSAVWSEAVLPTGAHPYGGLTVDTELRRNRAASGEAAPRQLETSLSAGLSWSWSVVPRLRVGLVARDYGPLDRARRFGAIAEGQLLVKPRERGLGLDLRVLLEALGQGGANVRRADLDARLLVPIRGSFVLVPGVNWYLYDDSEIAGSVSYLRISVGFGYSWTTRTPRVE